MDELVGTLVGTWSMTEIAGVVVPESAPAEIAFLDDGTLNGGTGVNRFRGSYVLVDDTLTVGPLMTTRMAGPPEAMEQEQRVLGVLGKPLSVRIDQADVLLDDGHTTTRLVATPDP